MGGGGGICPPCLTLATVLEAIDFCEHKTGLKPVEITGLLGNCGQDWLTCMLAGKDFYKIFVKVVSWQQSSATKLLCYQSDP